MSATQQRAAWAVLELLERADRLRAALEMFERAEQLWAALDLGDLRAARERAAGAAQELAALAEQLRSEHR